MALTSMQKLWNTNGIGTIITNIKKTGQKHRILVAHGMLSPDQDIDQEKENITVDHPYAFAIAIPSIQAAMVFCEELLLKHYGLETWCAKQGDLSSSPQQVYLPTPTASPTPSPALSAAETPKARCFSDVLADLVPNCKSNMNESDWLRYFEKVELASGNSIFLHGDEADRVFVLAAGTVVSSCDNADAFRRVDDDTGANSDRQTASRSPSNTTSTFTTQKFPGIFGVSSASTQGLYPEPLSLASAGHLVPAGHDQQYMNAMRLPRLDIK